MVGCASLIVGRIHYGLRPNIKFIFFKQFTQALRTHSIAALCVSISWQHYRRAKHFWTHKVIDIVCRVSFFQSTHTDLTMQPSCAFIWIPIHQADHCSIVDQAQIQGYNPMYITHFTEVVIASFISRPCPNLEYSTLTHYRFTSNTSFTLMWQVVTL